jgi:cytochrome P450
MSELGVTATSTRSRRLPPGPKPRFLLGNLPEFGSDLLGFAESCARDYGDVVKIHLGGYTTYLLNHPDALEVVLLTNYQNFVKHSFFWRHVTAIFGEGLLTSEGQAWLARRKLMAPAFHTSRIRAYGEDMVGYAEQMLETWSDGEVRNVHADMMALTMRIVGKTLFDSELTGNEADVGRAFDDVVEEIARRFRRPFLIPDFVPIPGNVRYSRGVRRLNELIYALIEDHRASGRDRGDLLSMLMNARDEDGARLTDQELRDESVTLFLAGHETTAIALSWTWYLLAEHPEVEVKLLDELGRVLSGRLPRAGDLPELPYTESVVKESMRLYPPAYGFGREAVDDCEIGGYDAPAGTTLLMFPWLIHRDERFYDEPEAFRPERWASERAAHLPRFAYVPFGGGPRICIGNQFAMMEAMLILATVVPRFRLERVREREVKPFTSITLRPDGGVWARLKRR